MSKCYTLKGEKCIKMGILYCSCLFWEGNRQFVIASCVVRLRRQLNIMYDHKTDERKYKQVLLPFPSSNLFEIYCMLYVNKEAYIYLERGAVVEWLEQLGYSAESRRIA